MADPTSDLVVADDLTIPASELRWRFSRSSGPGGRSVNTSDSRVELFLGPGRLRVPDTVTRDRLRTSFTVVASEHRS